MTRMNKEIYISVDIEADGAIPGKYSMTALGASAVGVRNADGTYTRLDITDRGHEFYGELKPISDEWVPEAMAVGIFRNFNAEQAALDPTGTQRRHYIETVGENPATVMNDFAKWVEMLKTKYQARPIFAAYPLGFDWLFTYWYLCAYTNATPFGHSAHIDIKTLYAGKAGVPISKAVKARMEKHLKPRMKHTHLALDDAKEQGVLLMNILEWEPKKN